MTDLNPRNWTATVTELVKHSDDMRVYVEGFARNEKRDITYPFHAVWSGSEWGITVRKPTRAGASAWVKPSSAQYAAALIALNAHDKAMVEAAHVNAVMDAKAPPAPTPAASAVEQFKVGKVYACRSACDHECIFHWKVVSRTAKSITLVECMDATGEAYGNPKRRGVKVSNGKEYCLPSGRYSMAPIITPDKVAA